MDSTGRTFEDFLKEPNWITSNRQWEEDVEREEKLERLDDMARNIEIYRKLLQTVILQHNKEIYIKCQIRWMQRYIKLAESIF